MIKRYKIVSNKRAFSSLQFNLTIEDNVASDDLQFKSSCEGAGQEEWSTSTPDGQILNERSALYPMEDQLSIYPLVIKEAYTITVELMKDA